MKADEVYVKEVAYKDLQFVKYEQKNGGLYLTFEEVSSGEEYFHFQPMPNDLSKGKSKAVQFLNQILAPTRILARKYGQRIPTVDELLIDCTQSYTDYSGEEPVRRIGTINNPELWNSLIGNFYMMKCITKKMKDSTVFNSAESILHYEGDLNYNLSIVTYKYRKLTEGRWRILYRRRNCSRSFEEFQKLFLLH